MTKDLSVSYLIRLGSIVASRAELSVGTVTGCVHACVLIRVQEHSVGLVESSPVFGVHAEVFHQSFSVMIEENGSLGGIQHSSVLSFN
jgi:hypothetical protein